MPHEKSHLYNFSLWSENVEIENDGMEKSNAQEMWCWRQLLIKL